MNATPVTYGTLHVVATPIGHPDDITIRALKVLGQVNLIAAEDTRQTRKLLSLHHITATLVSYHEHNEKTRTLELIKKLKSGSDIALVSDAGTPLVSDPGYRLVEKAVAHGIRVVPIPGASAAMAALSVSGLATDAFVFIGFLIKKKAKRIKQLQSLAREAKTIILYESPHRIARLLDEIRHTMGERTGVLCREMTKPYEEILRGTVSEMSTRLKKRSRVKGECTLVLSGCRSVDDVAEDTLKADIQAALTQNRAGLSKTAKQIAKKYGLPKEKVYAWALEIQGKKSPSQKLPNRNTKDG